MHYFDNAATTFPKPEQIYTKMDYFSRNYCVNVGRGQFKEASYANSMVEETRELLLSLFHCNRSNRQVVFTPSATEAINLVLRGIDFNDNDVIYTTPFEHNAVLRTLFHLKETKHIKQVYKGIDDNDPEALKLQIELRDRLKKKRQKSEMN